MVFDPPKARRRSIRWLVPILLVGIALVALGVSSAGSDTRVELEYLDRISEQSEQLALGGDALRDVVSRLSRIDRPELVTVIENLQFDLATGLELVEEDPPAPELVAVRALYRVALQEWSDGVARFGEGVLAAADNKEDAGPADMIADAIVALRAGDQLYGEMITELARVEVRDPVQALRDVTLAPATGNAVILGNAYTEAARSDNNGLALRPGLAVSMIVSDPDWQLNPDNMVIMPATEAATFSVIISNVGNLRSMPEQLTLTLTGTGEPVIMTATIDPLDPLAQTTVAFESIPVLSGELYEVTAMINVQDIDFSF
ncbi:MAG: hypothetical protein OEM39_01080, partial [Acidimicrobiia bacterium]|nr:hypothetical protein [Acidimicrobiia bacterium]